MQLGRLPGPDAGAGKPRGGVWTFIGGKWEISMDSEQEGLPQDPQIGWEFERTQKPPGEPGDGPSGQSCAGKNASQPALSVGVADT